MTVYSTLKAEIKWEKWKKKIENCTLIIAWSFIPSLRTAQRLKWKIRSERTVRQLWLWASDRFVKLEVCERWISIIGGKGTASLCVQWHCNHWESGRRRVPPTGLPPPLFFSPRQKHRPADLPSMQTNGSFYAFNIAIMFTTIRLEIHAQTSCNSRHYFWSPSKASTVFVTL